MESKFSNEMNAEHPNFAPAAPTIVGIDFTGRIAKVQITLPVFDEDSGALTGLAGCNVFYKDSSFTGSTPEAERLAGTSIVTIPVTPEMVSSPVTVEVPDLLFGKVYYFVATCND
jgi:hypothetical protein